MVVLTALSVGPAIGRDLAARIDALLSHANLRKARVGVVVESLTSGKVLYARAPHLALIPASNTKLVTCAAALGFLGADACFRTRLLVDGVGPDDGIFRGDLIVQGSGDPCLQDRFCNGDARGVLVGFGRRLLGAGIRRVTGDLVIDAGCFDDHYVAPGWPANQLGLSYCAPVAGLSLQNNCLRVICDASGRPGARARVSLWPPTRRYSVRNELRLTAERRVNQVALTRPDDQGRVRVRGRLSVGSMQRSYEVPVRVPPLFVAGTFQEILRELGIVLEGRVRMGRVPDTGNPREIARHESPLVEALAVMCKESDNGIAEHLFKSIGARRYGQGSFENGARAVAHLLRSLRVPSAEGTFVDGSGLSRENRISATGMVSLLAWVYGGPYRDPFMRSLAVAGVDGTLEDRMTEDSMKLRVRAKSGYLRGVSALSGVARSAGAETIAFSILINGFSGSNRTMKGIQDNICRELVRLERETDSVRAKHEPAGG